MHYLSFLVIVGTLTAASAQAQAQSYERHCDYVKLSGSGEKDCPPKPQENDMKALEQEALKLSYEVGANNSKILQMGNWQTYNAHMEKDDAYQQLHDQTIKDLAEVTALNEEIIKNPQPGRAAALIRLKIKTARHTIEEQRYALTEQEKFLK